MKHLRSIAPLLGALTLWSVFCATPAAAQCSGTPSANQVCAGPASGGVGQFRARALTASDVHTGSITQAWDADLDALAALSGTNTIYYRSAANTWSAVSIGSFLSFSVGTLNIGDVELTALGGLTSANNKCFYWTGSGTAANYDCTSFGRSVANAADAAALRVLAATVIGTDVQAYNARLAGIAGLASTANRLYGSDGSGNASLVTLPAAGLSLSAGAISLTNDLSALEGLASTGFAVRTTTDTWAQRSLSAPAAGFTITNPAGVAGDPTFVLANDLAALEGLASTGIARRTGTDAWSVGTTVSVAEGGSGLASGTSGGVLCFTGTTTAASSALLTQYGILYGGGAGACPVAMAAGTDGQIVVGQTGAAPLWKTITGDVTVSAAGAMTIGATKVTSAMLNADVFSTAHSWAGVQTFTNPIVGTQSPGDNSTKAASTAYADAIAALKANLASPSFTGTVDITQAFKLSGVISPTQISANTNDYAPTGFSTASTLRISTDASRNITGLAGGADGRIIIIHNVGAFDAVLKNSDGLSSAGNRFLFGGDMTLAADTSVTLRYDGTSTKWRAITSPGSGGGGGGGVTSVACAEGALCSTITTTGTVKTAFSRHFMLGGM